MGGGGRNATARMATEQNIALSDQLYGIAKPALSGAMGYLTDAYGRGGTLDTAQKYSAMQSNFLDSSAQTPGSFLDPRSFGRGLSGRASGLSGIAVEQLGSQVDEMNKIRSMLAGQGLKTTGMSAAAGGLESDALRYMNPNNNTQSLILGGAGLAAGLYGGGRDAGWWGQAAAPGFPNYAGQMPGMAAQTWGNGPATGYGTLGPINWGGR